MTPTDLGSSQQKEESENLPELFDLNNLLRFFSIQYLQAPWPTMALPLSTRSSCRERKGQEELTPGLSNAVFPWITGSLCYCRAISQAVQADGTLALRPLTAGMGNKKTARGKVPTRGSRRVVYFKEDVLYTHRAGMSGDIEDNRERLSKSGDVECGRCRSPTQPVKNKTVKRCGAMGGVHDIVTNRQPSQPARPTSNPQSLVRPVCLR